MLVCGAVCNSAVSTDVVCSAADVALKVVRSSGVDVIDSCCPDEEGDVVVGVAVVDVSLTSVLSAAVADDVVVAKVVVLVVVVVCDVVASLSVSRVDVSA